jgi:enoyl-CoA hydratase
MYSTLLTSIENNIFTITINRPDKLNALNNQVMQELSGAIDEIYNNSNIKSAIITGTGTKSFVAGADISEFMEFNKKDGQAIARKGQDIFFKIEHSPKPIIACVNGFALGGGCELAMSCHFRIASVNARFGQPEVNLGLLPGYGGTQRLTQLIGKGRALELLMSGNLIDAATALQYGLVNYTVPQDELLSKAISILNIINSKAPLAVAGCITAVNAVFETNKDGYAVEREVFAACFSTEDMNEGVRAFLEKRTASFTGK